MFQRYLWYFSYMPLKSVKSKQKIKLEIPYHLPFQMHLHQTKNHFVKLKGNMQRNLKDCHIRYISSLLVCRIPEVIHQNKTQWCKGSHIRIENKYMLKHSAFIFLLFIASKKYFLDFYICAKLNHNIQYRAPYYELCFRVVIKGYFIQKWRKQIPNENGSISFLVQIYV